jgi:hypothetical protein
LLEHERHHTLWGARPLVYGIVLILVRFDQNGKKLELASIDRGSRGSWRILAPMVSRLQCFRGISLHSAMVLATEIVDWRRFERPAPWACYLGLVSREDSSGDRTRLGSITKAGNSHCRHVLVQAAWSYRHRPQTSVDLQRRQQGQPPAVITHAWKAQQRLHQRYMRLSDRKRPQIAVVAVARELVGFLWSVMCDLETGAG